MGAVEAITVNCAVGGSNLSEAASTLESVCVTQLEVQLRTNPKVATHNIGT
jgi:hypothetical protein